MKVLQQLENVFAAYGRLNRILNDNWNDGNSESFNNDVITPITTEFSMYHSSVQDMQSRANSLEQEIEEELFGLEHELNDAYIPGDCHLFGYQVFRTYFEQNQVSVCRPFLVTPDEFRSLDGDKSYYDFFASGKYPAASECEGTYEEEMITIY